MDQRSGRKTVKARGQGGPQQTVSSRPHKTDTLINSQQEFNTLDLDLYEMFFLPSSYITPNL